MNLKYYHMCEIQTSKIVCSIGQNVHWVSRCFTGGSLRVVLFDLGVRRASGVLDLGVVG